MNQEEFERVGRSVYKTLGPTSENDRRVPRFSDDEVHEGDIVLGYVVIDPKKGVYKVEEGSDEKTQHD
jgi:hypothetical protein